MNAEQARGFGITSFCLSQGVEDHLFLGLVEYVVVLRAGEFGGLFLEDAVGKIFGEDLFGEAEDDGVLDGVLEFANISGPTVVHQQGARLLGDAFEWPFASFGVL